MPYVDTLSKHKRPQSGLLLLSAEALGPSSTVEDKRKLVSGDIVPQFSRSFLISTKEVSDGSICKKASTMFAVRMPERWRSIAGVRFCGLSGHTLFPYRGSLRRSSSRLMLQI